MESRMQIVIPMSGFGERFRRAGYGVPKPLIEIDGKPIIQHVVDMFPGETDFIFVCNRDHLANPDYRMAEILESIAPQGRIVGIEPHKLGPIHAVRQAADYIDLDGPVVANYCDFTCYWDFANFKDFVQQTNCDGAIPAYKGFHPHSLGTTNYAYMREQNGWVLDIQEKQPYTDNRMEEYASSGTYYFSSGRKMLDAFAATMDQNLNVNDEFYISLAYKPLLANGDNIAVYDLQHFMQWGTPEDVADYNNWSATFRRLLEPQQSPEPRGSLVVPMAGMGKRFTDAGYTETKPLIPVSGRPMVVQAIRDLPQTVDHAFVLRSDMPGYESLSKELAQEYGAVIEVLDQVTEGQAITARIGMDALTREVPESKGPITFGACDFGVLYDAEAFDQLANNPDIDIIVWGVRGNANAVRRPQMFGWIDAKPDGEIVRISVKEPLASPETDPIVLGTFTFRNGDVFHKVVQHLIDRDGRVNGEFYLDSTVNDAIDLGMKCWLFDVDYYLSWGTPDDLRTFEYWQSCFHKWNGHPYRLEFDGRVDKSHIAELEQRYKSTVPLPPAPR